MHLNQTKTTACVILLAFLATATLENAVAVTWSINITRFTDYAHFEGFPSIMQSNHGIIWITWAKDIFGNLTLVYRTSSDLGVTWTAQQNLTREPALGQNTNPSLIQARNGTMWLVWAGTEIQQTPPSPLEPDFTLEASPTNLTILKGDSANSTLTVRSLYAFSEPVNLTVLFPPSGVTTTLNPPQVTPPYYGKADSNLTISVDPVATPGNYTLSVMGKSSQKKHTISLFLEITDSGATSLDALASPMSSSTPLAEASAEEADYEIYYKVSHDDGATWSNKVQLTHNTVDDFKPTIIQLSNGTLFVCWQSDTTGNPDIFYTTTLNGDSWTTPTQLTTYSGFDKGPAAIQTKDGEIWVTWTSMRDGDYEIYCKIYSGSWSSATRLTTSTNSDVGPSILETVDEKIYLFWSSSTITSSNDIYYKYSSDNGATWSEPTQFTTNSYEDVWPHAIQTRDTKIRVVWTSNRADPPDGNWNIYYRTSLAGDVNGDGVVNIFDLSIVGLAFGSFEWEPEYDPAADLNNDGIVDTRDVVVVSVNYGAT
jgi:hypothetical protein